MIPRTTPSLRISRLVVQNFRTFQGPTEIPLASGGVADEVAVFHGGNGSGKSNALAALELFFRALGFWMVARRACDADSILRGWEQLEDASGLIVSHRDWPPGIRDPLQIDVHLADGQKFSAIFTQAGNQVTLRVDGAWAGRENEVPMPAKKATAIATNEKGLSPLQEQQLASTLGRLDAPMGPGSRPLFRFDARRRAYLYPSDERRRADAPASPLSAELAARLLELANSLEPADIERWRAFTELLSRFKTLSGREVNVVRQPDGDADLRFELRRKQILRVSELSSGEQQVVALCAAVLTSRAAIVAIEEPEISLDPSYQELLRDVLREQVRNGLVDQIILESHVPMFDGPEVIRFSRSPEGVTSVARQPSEAHDELRERARGSGAEDQWVTPEGYTKLPKLMLDDLGLQAGGYLWFVRSKPAGRWEAWKTEEIDQALGLPGDDAEG
ncbi:AAA family ATPase [Polyangium mundeleinium]|uniref:AAA family ATPase n=1 Tax=Polyangium mundeleinium TaxID=2995306 RepID=A0ABT5ETF8_9BACT|nr:ATP-binding protein [Polyangium mundeleinium]MDC0745112.1 AAA family ATPase [Polyangium mundeleinium]